MTRILGAICLALLVAFGVSLAYALHWRGSSSRNALAYSNELAAHDTTRAQSGKALAAARKLYGDSIRSVERRAIQAEIARDALDKATNRNTTTRVTGTATVGAITGTTSGTTAGSTRPPAGLSGDTATRVADYHLYRAPFKLDATARIPYAGSSTLDYTIALDSARITLRLACNRKAERGINAAIATAVTPQWLRLDLTRVEQSADICARNAAIDRKRARRWGIGGTLGYAAVRRPSDGEIVAGPGGSVGLTYRF